MKERRRKSRERSIQVNQILFASPVIYLPVDAILMAETRPNDREFVNLRL